MQEKIFRYFIGDQFRDKPIRKKGTGDGKHSKKLGYVFIGASAPSLATSCRTYSSLLKITEGDVHGLKATYWTVNTFYRSDIRNKDNLRWLNAVYVDLDEMGLSMLDVMDRITAAGLPAPTLLNKTPHGWHVYWAIEKVRAWPKAVALYEAIIRDIIRELEGADPKTATAEKYLRIPRDNCYFKEVRYDLSDFVTWREVNKENEIIPKERAKVYYISGCLSQRPFKVLLEGVDDGIRDLSAFTLALAHYKDGYSSDQTLNALREWNKSNSPPMPDSKLRSKVKSAYSGKYRGPSSQHVYNLTGIRLKFRPITPPKPREDRVRDHLTEVQNDIISYLAINDGRVEISQEEFAESLDVALRSLKTALKTLRKAGKVIAFITGKGRSTKAVYALLESVADVIRERMPHGFGWISSITQKIQELMVHSNIHLWGKVVGGCLLDALDFRMLVSLLE